MAYGTDRRGFVVALGAGTLLATFGHGRKGRRCR